jgi:methylenetetrahydrofolate dehydrogenase (NADP+)/methenyltetrahydrofolate cyclohydrolase
MILAGRQLAGFIKQRHYQQMRSSRAQIKLAIIMSDQADEAIRTYVRSSKSRYADDIHVDVDVHEIPGTTSEVLELISSLNGDPTVQGILLQLPFAGLDVDAAITAIDPRKDTDGLHPQHAYDPATAKAILWLLSSYGITWRDKVVTVVGQGRVVGAPLSEMLENSGAQVIRCDSKTKDLAAATLKADIVVSAVGKANLITRAMLRDGTVVVDAGTTEMNGNLVGDVDHTLYDDPTLQVTPTPGGVGPMTVAALFDNLLLAAGRE